MLSLTPTQTLVALAAGALFGVAASALAASHGRVAGFSGIFGNLLFADPTEKDRSWLIALVAGMATAGLASLALTDATFVPPPASRAPWMLPVAGLLVGFGTRMGKGCVSGHAVVGLARFSRRSLLAAGTFFLSGAIVVAILGGAR